MNKRTCRTIATTLLIMLGAVTLAGCGVGQAALADLTGWDLSACEGNFDVCFELFGDNTDKVLGGDTVLDLLLKD